MTVAQLGREANNYVFSPQVSFRNWIHVSKTLLYEAKANLLENDLEKAYVLYLRYADLVLNKLGTHPDAEANKVSHVRAIRIVPQVLQEAEHIKAKLQLRYTTFSLASPEPPTPAPPEPPRPSFSSLRSVEESTNPPSYPIHFDANLGKTLASLKQQAPAPVEVSRPATIAYPPPVRPGAMPPQPVWAASSPRAVATNYAYPLPSAQTTAPDGLRTLLFPRGLEAKFLVAAQANTKANLETCGILCGKIDQKMFVVSDLVIPVQESTSNTCTTLREELLFDYVDKRDLFILGWIHTHPSQTCFMSSVDLHTHSSYQIMLPEAIAAVCAPSHEFSFAIYRLTDPPGVDTIKNCRQTSFHPHDEPDLYCRAQPGHVQIAEYSFNVCDLRSV